MHPPLLIELCHFLLLLSLIITILLTMKFTTTVLTLVACVTMCHHLVAAKPMPASSGDDSKCQSIDDPRSKHLCDDYCKNNGVGHSNVVQCGKYKGICQCDGYKPIQPSKLYMSLQPLACSIPLKTWSFSFIRMAQRRINRLHDILSNKIDT